MTLEQSQVLETYRESVRAMKGHNMECDRYVDCIRCPLDISGECDRRYDAHRNAVSALKNIKGWKWQTDHGVPSEDG